jgi:hypothetical protein
MVCQGCINRQRKLVERLCRYPESRFCKSARARLERMLAKQQQEQKTK